MGQGDEKTQKAGFAAVFGRKYRCVVLDSFDGFSGMP